MTLPEDKEVSSVVHQIKTILGFARVKVAAQVNSELLHTYLQIGLLEN